MGEQREVERTMLSENSSLSETRPTGISIESLLNPASRPEHCMFRSRIVENSLQRTTTVERAHRKKFAQVMDDEDCMLKSDETRRKKESVEKEVRTCKLNNRRMVGRVLRNISHSTQDPKASQALSHRKSPQNDYQAHKITIYGGRDARYSSQMSPMQYTLRREVEKVGNETAIVARFRRKQGKSEQRTPAQNIQTWGLSNGKSYDASVPGSTTGCFPNSNTHMILPSPSSDLRADNNFSKRTTESQQILSLQNVGVFQLNESTSNNLPRRTSVTRKRKYLKKIGVPKYRSYLPLAAFGRRSFHTEHIPALNMENPDCVNLVNLTANEDLPNSVLAETWTFRNSYNDRSSDVYETLSAASGAPQFASTLPTSANRTTSIPVQNPLFYTVTDPSGFTFFTSQPPSHISPDVYVSQYTTSPGMISANFHISYQH